MVARRRGGRSGSAPRTRKNVMLDTGPSCAFRLATGMCSASGVLVRADGVQI